MNKFSTPLKIQLGPFNYTISYKPIPSKIKEKLSDADYATYLQLKKEPHIKECEALYRRNPAVPELSNLLTYHYFQKRKIKKGEKLIVDNYRNNPTDLFARINYADYCLRHNQGDKVPDIFNPTFDLKLLYPEKKEFHYSEIGPFTHLMCYTHLHFGNKEAALDYYRAAVQIDPEANGLLLLEKKLFKQPLFPTLRRIYKSVKLFFQSK